MALTLLIAGCDGGSGGSASPGTGDPPATFEATRQLLNEGEATLLRWDSPTADSVIIEPDIGRVEQTGTAEVKPAETTEYSLTARRGGATNVVPLTVTVRPFAAVTLVANTVEGDAPLAVRFTPELDSLTAINRIYWDFAGDGGDIDGGLGDGASGFDSLRGFGEYDVTGRDFTHEFETPGTYSTRVRVWDVEGNQAESELTVTVRNAAPEAQVRVTPTSGTAPVDANFVVEASDNEGIASYDWDYDGDGEYDESTETPRARHRYETSGSFRPRIRITDMLGTEQVLDPLHLQVNASETEIPAVTVTTRPVRGPAPLEVALSASVRGASPAASWAWDFDGDGQSDSSEAGPVNHVYERAGTFYPTLTVTAEDGSVGRDIFDVVVDAAHVITISDDAAINPESGEAATVTLAVNGGSEMSLVVEDASGGVVRTLAPPTDRASGEYEFTWNGSDENGSTAPPGDYYAVLRYTVDGVERVLDGRTLSGGEVFYPSGWGGTCRYTETPECGVLEVSENPVQPFAAQPLEYRFTTPYNARVTAYVTVIGTENFAPATFFRAREMAAGSYTIEWFGTGTDGQLLPVRERNGYLPAIYGQRASDNAIFLSHATTLENLTVGPPILYPTASVGPSKSTLTFDLSRDADVLMTVDDTGIGAEVLRREFFDMPAGSGRTLEWDGRNAAGDLVAPGGYRVSLIARDRFGQRALPARAMQRIRY